MSFNKSSHYNPEGQKNSHNPLKHLGMMGLCCLLPLIIIGILPLLNINNAGANLFISGLSSLICPIMMGVMMFNMFRGGKNKGCCEDENKGGKDENRTT